MGNHEDNTMPKFDVTFEIWTPEDCEHGDTDNRGFVVEGVSLREAVREIGHYALEADCWPVSSPRCFTNFEYDENFQTGARESRSLHLPNHLTEASRMRIARLLGVVK
jgi:hypothetical protein